MKIIHFRVFLIVLFSTSCLMTQGQYAHFIETGSIEYERSVNMYAILGKDVRPQDALSGKFFEAYKASEPQFHTSTFTLNFTGEESRYEVKELTPPAMGFFRNVPWVNASQVYTNFAQDSTLSLRQVFEASYAIKDKQQPILWKMTDETREIAGYTCRRANGLILDSVYVVAFFTTEILPQGGPESFSGLPGMILGAALPHEHVTWFATRVEEGNPGPIAPPELKKSLPVLDRKSLLLELEKQVGKRRNRGKMILKATLL